MKYNWAKRIIIGGPPRTGSTLLRTVLGSSSKLLDCPETSFFLNPLSHNKQRSDRIAKRVNRALDIGESFIEGKTHDADSNQQAFDSMMYKYAEQNKRTRCIGWIEKTPRNCYHYHRLMLEMEDVFFISTVRNGRAVVTSKKDTGEYWCTVDRYVDSMRCVYGFMHPRHYIIRYEDLIDNTEDEINKLYRFLGLSDISYDEEKMRRFQKKFDETKVRQALIKSPLKNYAQGRDASKEHVKPISEFEQNDLAVFFNQRAGY